MSRPKGSRNKKTLIKESEIKVAEMPSMLEVPSKIKSSLKIAGELFEAEGQTIPEAITNLKTGFIKGRMGVLTLERNGLKKEKILTRNLIFRVFGDSSRMHKEIGLKNVSAMFEGI